MTLGEKLRQARLEAGISQRSLCGGEITRNMLSMIEHDSASPSIATLKYLADRLGKPMGFFLDDTLTQTSDHVAPMTIAIDSYCSGLYQTALNALKEFTPSDSSQRFQYCFLKYLILVSLAQTAVSSGKLPYARTLLAEAQEIEPSIPWISLERKLLQGRIETQQEDSFPNIDELLLQKAQAACASGHTEQAARFLDAAENTNLPGWHFTYGKVLVEEKKYAKAIEHFLAAEKDGMKEAYSWLETCYRETGDFENAYRYACMQRK